MWTKLIPAILRKQLFSQWICRIVSPGLLTSLIIIASSVLLSYAPPALAEPTESPKTCLVGVYIGSLHDFNLAEKSFDVDFWAWSVCPSEDMQPLKTMSIVNTKEVTTSYDAALKKKNIYGLFSSQEYVYWSTRKVSATINYNWNIYNYPFDRHVLEISLEESVEDATQFVYTVDESRSSIRNNMYLEGWRITDFKIKQTKIPYQTTFGDPELPTDAGSEYSRMTIAISISRDKIISFFKLTAGVYAAFAISLLSLFYDSGQTSLMSARSSILVGSLFAALVNMRVIDAVLGRTEGLTLVDKIHITTIAYIFAAAVVGVCSRLIYEVGREKLALRFDRHICFSVFAISFAVINVILIMEAVKVG